MCVLFNNLCLLPPSTTCHSNTGQACSEIAAIFTTENIKMEARVLHKAKATLSTSRKRFCQMGEDCARLAIRARALRYSAITPSKSPRSVAALHVAEKLCR